LMTVAISGLVLVMVAFLRRAGALGGASARAN
jgi:hypothetical protein